MLIGPRIGDLDLGFQSRLVLIDFGELADESIFFQLQLLASRLAQFFGMHGTNPGKVTFDIFGLEIVFQFRQTDLDLGLAVVKLTQVSPQLLCLLESARCVLRVGLKATHTNQQNNKWQQPFSHDD